jgi:TPR repeat protein
MDYRVAVSHYDQGCKRFLGKACHALGRMYEFGLGVPPNRAEAIRLYRLAGSLGNSQGAYHAKWLSVPSNLAFNNDAGRMVYMNLTLKRWKVPRNHVLCGPSHPQYCVEMVFYHLKYVPRPTQPGSGSRPGPPCWCPRICSIEVKPGTTRARIA